MVEDGVRVPLLQDFTFIHKDHTVADFFGKAHLVREKAFDKIQHPPTIKTRVKVSIEGSHLNIIIATYDKSTVNRMHNSEK